MVIDRMVPFRFVVIQLIFMASILIYSIISWVKQGYSVSFFYDFKIERYDFKIKHALACVEILYAD